ncbi:lariat debranching enzyme, C-terminal domain-containing protein [Mycena metata]|uniref:Lariat debranching enzyme, C-terminal domain-containing protein n=1 Tax=Mycena metata TaxID=1033252 RepID=A0AAD7HHF0_9AGAR|nr:lariat debranching enzyme, C-terminal domain-containing protein [Mycena metata]
MRIAVVGCSHGGLDTIYKAIHRVDSETKKSGELPVELLLCCGDFQAIRNNADIYTMKAPSKYRLLRDFHNYYAGRKKAPMLTLVVGGNHEANSHMRECFHGAWLAPNIYFLGYAGCVLVDGWLRVAGSSGIYKAEDYEKGHFERLPYIPSTLVSTYHTRQYGVERLMNLQTQGPKVDIFMSHDWPRAIELHGDTAALIREKPNFEHQVDSNTLGSVPLETLLKTLKPARWCSGHMHVRFTAEYKHGNKSAPDSEMTKFLALSKPGVNREFLEVIDVPTPAAHQTPSSARQHTPTLFFDPHWLAIVRAYAPFLPLAPRATPLPAAAEAEQLIADALAWVRQNVSDDQKGVRGLKAVGAVQVFKRTAPPTRSSEGKEDTEVTPKMYNNPQTQAFCDMLGIPNQIRYDYDAETSTDTA